MRKVTMHKKSNSKRKPEHRYGLCQGVNTPLLSHLRTIRILIDAMESARDRLVVVHQIELLHQFTHCNVVLHL